jgi:outer membrane protein
MDTRNSGRRTFTMGLALLAASALAHTASGKDLIGVFQDALQADPVIRQANANRLAAREARPQAWSAVLPQINGTTSQTRDHNEGYQDQIVQLTPTSPVTVVPYGIVAGTKTDQWALNLKQNVFSWANWVALKQAGSEVAQAEATYAAAEQELILRVAQAYFNVLADEDSVEANESSLVAFSQQLDQANTRFAVGLVALTDVEEAKAAHDQAAAAVIAAKRTLATAEDQLQEITGQKYDSLQKLGDDMPLKPPEPASEDRWVETSLDQNLSLIASRLAADIARDNVRIAFGGHVPTIDIQASRSYMKSDANETLDGFNFPNYDSKNNDRQITLELTVPIFSGGYAQSKVRQAQYLWIAAKEGVVQSSRATERQARDAYLGVISGIAHVQALRQALASDQTAVQATEAGYEVGTRVAVDVLNARKTLVQGQTDYSAARYDYIVSVLQLRLAAGNLDRAELAEINGWLTVRAPTSPSVATPESLGPTPPAATGATPPAPRQP